MEDEETVALAAAIRQPWQPSVSAPYEPAPYEPPRYPASPSGPARAGGGPTPAYRYPAPLYAVPAFPVVGYPPAHWSSAAYPVTAYAVPVYPVPMPARRQVAVAYLLWFLFGLFGVHQFYLGHVLRGVLYLLTGGGFGIGLLVDLFLIPSMTRRRNAEAIGRAYQRWSPQLR